ncbi:GNAT family N-acetyltransferase [Chitinimonas sp. BJB300]|nr:GNAT family N-acetyltransferase [Chitinimonas sp. BJB300]PHV10013.1 GNAT family N-acetyltransferase [Chitinimonas sp. BJB300]
MQVYHSPEILTARLQLRLVRQDDLPELLAIHSVEEVNRYLPYITWQDIDDAQVWFDRVTARHEEGSAAQFVILERATSRVVGSCLLFRFDLVSSRAEVGYVLGQPYWHLGYMQEALAGLFDYAFGKLGMRRIEAEVDPLNKTSHTLLLRLGFQCEGLLRQRWLTKGEIKDTHIYGLLSQDWPPELAD